MNSFIKGILFTLGVLSLFGIVFAIGFHSANEIVSGTFSGDYIFEGNLDFTNASIIGNGSSSMITNWPDVIKCYDGTTHRILYAAYGTESSTKGYRQLNTNEIRIIYNNDGSYSSNDNMETYDCVTSSMSIQQLYETGQAFNLVGGFDNHKISCPTGFTSLESKGRQLGCIQNDENIATTYYGASNHCWETYAGRLPTTEEWYLGTEYYILNDETNNWERTSDAYGSAGGTNRHAISGNGGNQQISWGLDSINYAYRCFIPN